MFAWLEALPAVLVAVGIVTLPGIPAAWLLRLRGLALVAAAIAASLAAVVLASLAAPLLGLRWGIIPVLLAAAVIAAPMIAVRSLTRANNAVPRARLTPAPWTAAAVLLAGAIIASTVTQAIGSPENISQTFDGVFHINAAAKILLSGDASPLHMDLSTPGSAAAFYPTVWHSVVTLVAQLTGASIPVATNAFALTVSAWIWPVGILFFSRPFFAHRPVHLILGAVLTASFTAYPYLLLAWGVLYPNLLSTSLIPIALGFLYPALRYRQLHPAAPRAAFWVATAGAIGATAFSHPNGLFGIAAFATPMLMVAANDVQKLSVPTRVKLARWAALLIPLLCFAGMWIFVRTGDNSREFGGNIPKALLDGVTNAPMLDARSWFLTLLVASGVLVLLLRKRHRWLIASYAIALGLFVISSGMDGSLRDTFTGAWYNDAHRLAALLPIATVPLSAIAAAQLANFVSDGIRRVDLPRHTEVVRRLLPTIGVILLCGLVFTGARGMNFVLQTGWISDLHTPDGELLSVDERTLLERLPEEVPEGESVAGDPWTGTGLALAISHRDVLFGHLQGSYDADRLNLASSLNTLGPAACPMLERLGVSYLLDFGDSRYSIGDDSLYDQFEGLSHLEESPVLTEIDREGDAALFVVNCG